MLDLEALASGARVVDDQEAEVKKVEGEIKALEEKKESRGLTLLKADNFLRYVLLHSTSGDPNVMVRRIMRTTSSDSEIVAGLEIWRQMAVTYAGSAQTRVVTLLKQIMTPSEWNPEKSSNVLQQYHHWLELISKYESLSSEKIAPSIKITLALQNVRGPLANALSLSITEKSTWNDIHNLLINYFNNSITTDSKEIYQFDISGKVSKEDSVNQVGKKGKGKSKKSKGQSKGKGSSQNQTQKGKGKSKGQSKGKTKSKGKGQWTTWSGQSWSWNQNQGQGQGGKGKGKGHQVCSHCGRKGHSVDQCWWAQKTSSSGTSSDQRQVYNISAQPGDHSVAVMPTDQLRGFQDLRPVHQQQSINQPYFSQPSSSSAVSSVFASGQGQGFSGHHLRINHFTSDVSEDYIMEVNISNPIYDIGPSLPQECQEPWAALIDTGAVASIAPQSFVPHIPIKEKSETLTSVNGGHIKVLGIKHVTFITGKLIIHVNFLIVEDVKNPIIGLDAIHHNQLQVHLHGKGKCILQQHHHKALLHYHQSHYYASGLVLPDHVQGHHLRWSDPQFTVLDKQSASNIIAEIDDKIISESRKIILEEENQEDLSQQAQVPHCLKVPSTPSAAERELHELTHLPFRSWCEVCQRAKGLQGQHKHQSQKKSSVIQLDHSFYKVPGSVQNLKVLTFIETSTSMCGAVIVPDLSANQVGIKALKQFIMVNGFTHSVLQCDGHSGLMKLQDQVGKDLSLPTQISPPYSHQSQGTVERFHKTLYGQVRAIKLGLAAHLGIHPDSTAARLMPWIISHAVFTINRYLIRQDGKTSYERVFNKAHSGPLVHFGERVLAHHQATPPAQKLHLRAQPQKHYSLWLGKCVITGMHIVAHEGQILKTRTVTRLVRDQQFNAVEFNKIILPPHESEPHYQEPQEDRMALQELLRSFIMQQQSKMRIQDFKPSDQRFNVTVEHADPIITASSAEGANQRSATSTATSSSQPLIIPHPPGLPIPQGVQSQPQVQQPQQAPQDQPQQPVQVRRRFRTKTTPQVSEISAVLQDIKENHLPIGKDQVNADHQEAQIEEELLQGLILQEWYQGDLQGYSADQIKQAITKELKQIGPQGHDAYDPVPLSHLSPEERRSIIESRWVIGPRPGSELKGRFCAKGFKQVISRDDKYASTPQATTLKLILLMSQIHSWEIAVSDIASAFLNTPVDPSKPPIYVQAPREIQYSEPTVWRLKRQLYGLRDAPKSWQAHFSQIMVKKGMTQMKSDSCAFLKKDQDGHVQLVVMAYVDDLVISGSAQMVKDFIVSIQEEFTLKHVNFLTPENPIEFLGRSIKRLKNGNITMEFSQKFIDDLLRIFEVTGKVTTTGLKLQAIPEDQKVQCDRVIHQKFRSAVGKLLWMAQLRDDLKYPVKELSRSLINPQDQDVKNLVHLLKYVNQTRDFVFVMEPQLPVRNQDGKFPVQISSYSDSDWAGCQKSRKSTSGSLISVFNINLQSTSRTQASIAHSSAESELYAMTQASVESLAIKNFIQEFNSPILSPLISIVIQTDSSAGKSMASRLGISRRSKHIELKYLWIQDEIKEGKLELKKVGTHFNPSDILTKYVPASVLGQHLPRLNIFKVPFQRSKSVLLSAHTGQSVQCSSHPQPPSTSTSSRSPTPLSVFMFSVNLDHQEHLRQRLRQASRSIKRVLTPPRRGSGDQESNVLRRQHVNLQESEVQENQDSRIRESVQEDSDSSVHGQRHVPPQNQESTSQWSSWVRSRFSVSVSLRSLSWRRQGQERNQENQEHQEGINQRLSHLYLSVSRIMSYVLFYFVFCSFVIFLFNSLHPSNQPSVQKSSAQPFVTEAVFDSISESELTASASFASLQSVTSSLSSVIMALSSAIKSAHEAASTLAGQPQPSDDVVMVSADPVLIINNHHNDAIESAEIRTDIAMSGLTVSSSSDPSPSLVRYAITASLPSERMDMCHLSEDVKMFASSFKAGSDTFDFKQFMDSRAQRHWFILNDAEFKLWNQHHVLQVPRVKDPSGGHILNWKLHQSLQDAIYHMIYLTVAHCVRHGSVASSSDLSTTYSIVSGVMLPGHLQFFEEEDLFGIKSLNLMSSAPGHLRISSFMDQIQIFRAFAPLLGSSGSTSAFMQNHVLYYESVSISDKYVSSSLSCIISHRTARLNERVYSLMIKFHPHLVTVFFQNQPGQEKEFKHSVTEFTVKPSFFIEALISSPHLDGLDQQASSSAMQISSPSAFSPQQASSLMVKSAVINIR